jgi:hypothetical protein
MSRLSQMIDYINQEPKKLSNDYIKTNYTHFTIDETAKKVRKKLRIKPHHPQ